MSEGIGTIVTSQHVARAVRDTLGAWMPRYVALLETAESESARPDAPGLGEYPAPRSIITAAQAQPGMAEEQHPCVVVSCPGTTDTPSERGDGAFASWWRVDALIIATGDTGESTLEITSALVACVRAILVQQCTLDGFAQDVAWIGESTDDTDPRSSRTFGAGSVSVAVLVNDVLTRYGPIGDPPDDPYEAVSDPYPDIETHDEIVTREDELE